MNERKNKKDKSEKKLPIKRSNAEWLTSVTMAFIHDWVDIALEHIIISGINDGKAAQYAEYTPATLDEKVRKCLCTYHEGLAHVCLAEIDRRAKDEK